MAEVQKYLDEFPSESPYEFGMPVELQTTNTLVHTIPLDEVHKLWVVCHSKLADDTLEVDVTIADGTDTVIIDGIKVESKKFRNILPPGIRIGGDGVNPVTINIKLGAGANDDGTLFLSAKKQDNLTPPQ